ncbi:5'-nucleotidase C-terminal domain-containing protein [Micromonospora sp. BRA006-A]|nr:5'-nucleotidase C-terminal domain-containing protein [Micromonospora sp. BRA006-A]
MWNCRPPSRGTRTPRSWTSSTTSRPGWSPRRFAGGEYAGLPVLSIAAPFSRTAVFPQGDVRIRDVAGLYVYDNTLEAVVLTGAEVKAYLEYSAKYFVTLPAGAPVNPETISDRRCRTTTTTCSPASTTTSTSPSRSGSGSPAWCWPAPAPRSRRTPGSWWR